MSKFDTFEPAWAAAAMHECGHAVAFKKAGIRVTRVTLSRGLFGGIAGDTSIDEDTVTEARMRGFLVGMLAGIEAEARYLARHHGYSLGSGRRLASDGGSSDLAVFAKHAKGSGLSRSAAQNKAESLASWHYGRIESAAATLARSGRLGSWGI